MKIPFTLQPLISTKLVASGILATLLLAYLITFFLFPFIVLAQADEQQKSSFLSSIKNVFKTKTVEDYFPLSLKNIKQEEFSNKPENGFKNTDECVDVKKDGDSYYVKFKFVSKQAGYKAFVNYKVFLVKPDIVYRIYNNTPGIGTTEDYSNDLEHAPIFLKLPGKTDSDSWTASDVLGNEHKFKVYYNSITTKYKKYDDCLVVENQSTYNGMPDIEKDYYAKNIGWVYKSAGDLSMQLIDEGSKK